MSLIGRKVPEFKATAFKKGEKDFITVTDKDLLGKWSVFVFYPADFTFVCPTELEDLQDHYEDFKKEGAEVYQFLVILHLFTKHGQIIQKELKKLLIQW